MNQVDIVKGLASKDPNVIKSAREAFAQEIKPLFDLISGITPEITAEATQSVKDLLDKHNIRVRILDSAKSEVTRNF
jgi:hypothetical protein